MQATAVIVDTAPIANLLAGKRIQTRSMEYSGAVTKAAITKEIYAWHEIDAGFWHCRPYNTNCNLPAAK